MGEEIGPELARAIEDELPREVVEIVPLLFNCARAAAERRQ